MVYFIYISDNLNMFSFESLLITLKTLNVHTANIPLISHDVASGSGVM